MKTLDIISFHTYLYSWETSPGGWWEGWSLPTKSEWACDLDRNEAGLLTPSPVLFPPKDAALSQDMANVYFSREQIIRRVSSFKEGKSLYLLQILLLDFHTMAWM